MHTTVSMQIADQPKPEVGPTQGPRAQRAADYGLIRRGCSQGSQKTKEAGLCGEEKLGL